MACEADHNNKDFDKTLKGPFYFKLYALQWCTWPLCPDKRISEQKGFWGLWESKIVKEREPYQKDVVQLKGKAHVNSCRAPFNTSSWKGV